MKSSGDISIGFLIVLIVLVCLEIYFVYKKNTEELPMEVMDRNGDGVVSREELKFLIEHDLLKTDKALTLRALSKSAASGALRGFLSGMLINGFEGGITGSMVLMIINPIITGFETVF